MEVPKKIKPFFIKKNEKGDNSILIITGDLSCCKKSDFEIAIIGKVKKKPFLGEYLISENEEYNELLLTAKCKNCEKVIDVYNSATDGYNCCIENHPQVKGKTNPYSCKKCSSNNFSINIKYEYSGIDELEEVKIKNKDNAFSWIRITLKCNNCHTTYKNFIDIETD